MEAWAIEFLTQIEDCEARESRLSDWDRTFLDSIKSQITKGKTLTFAQQSKLDEVWERATAKG